MTARLLLAAVFLTLCSSRAAVAGIAFSRLLGSASINAAAVDSAGNVYLAGSTQSAGFAITPGVVQPKFGGGTCVSYNSGPLNPFYYPCDDAIVVKLDPNGNVVWSTFLGGSGIDIGNSIAVDRSGNVYVAGNTSPANQATANTFPTTPGAAFPLNTGNALLSQGFIAKLNPAGSALLYSTLIPGGLAGIAIDAQGLVYFTGNDGTGGFPATAGAFQRSKAGVINAIAGKLNAAGSALVYGTYLGGGNYDYGADIAIDPAGEAYITGETTSTNFPVTAGAFQASLPSKNLYSAFVAKLNPSGSGLIYATYLGGSDADQGNHIRVDSQGNAYILGEALSTDFPITSSAFQSELSDAAWLPADQSAFLSKLNADGSALVYATFLSGSVRLESDAAGNAYVLGQAGRGFPVTAGARQRCWAGGSYDLFVAQFSPQGQIAAGTYFGGAGLDSPGAVAISPDGLVVVAGTTTSPDFVGAQPTVLYAPAAFVAKTEIANRDRPDTPCMALVLQNSASYAEGVIAPGELVTLWGVRFGPDAGTSLKLDSNGHIATSLGGVQVFFDDQPAPVLYAQSQQINVQVPWELAGKTATQVHVVYNGGSTNTAAIPVGASSPGLFHLNYTSAQGAINNEDGTINSSANPAPVGSVIAIYGTGGGTADPLGITGGFTPLTPLQHLTQPVTVQIGGIDQEVLYAGAAPSLTSGVFQVNVRVQQVMPGGQALSLSIGGVPTPNFPVTVAVQ